MGAVQSGARGKAALQACAALLAVLSAGCASPGVPRPPSLHLPALVRDLTAVRQADSVHLRFTAPQQTTDKLSLTTRRGPVPLTAVVCHMAGQRCDEVERMPVLPGTAYESNRPLPPDLLTGPPRPISFRIRVLNAAGRDAGPGPEAVAAAGSAPPAMRDLAATTVKGGVQLTWRSAGADVAPVRVEATTENAATTTAGPRRTVRLLQPAESLPQPSSSAQDGRPARDPGGAIDPVPRPGDRVTYRVFRLVTLPANAKGIIVPLEGASASVTVTRGPDIFAPVPPTGLLAVTVGLEQQGDHVSLSWEPSDDTDVVGYNVYRAETGGSFTRVNTTPVRGVSYLDPKSYSREPWQYRVTAVDKSGNESQPSPTVEVQH